MMYTFQRQAALLLRRAASVGLQQQPQRQPRSYHRPISTMIALTRDLPDSFGDAIVEHYNSDNAGDDDVVDLLLAKAQHDEYVKVLRELNVPTLSLPADHNLPDSVFVEDTAVVIRHPREDNSGRDSDNGGDTIAKALIMKPGHESRQPEVDDIRRILQRFLPPTHIFEMAELDKYARCDGGDVLYTGRHLFVGVTERTNEEALQVFEKVFDNVPLIPVPMPPNTPVLHLKSAVTHMDASTLVAPSAAWANGLLRTMRTTALGYDVIRIPNVLACNMVVLPECQAVLLQDTPCTESRAILEQAAQERNLTYRWVNTLELAKKDAALTCCSILLP